MKKTFFFLFTVVLFALLIVPGSAFGQRPQDKGPLDKVTFIHYRKDHKPADLPEPRVNEAKPPWAGGGKGGESKCYAFISKGARWKEEGVGFTINPVNGDGLQSSFVKSAFDSGAGAWDTQVPGFDIFGASTLDSTASFSFDSYDGENVVLFDAYSDPDVIAVTNVWGYFGGPPQTREIVEWDMLLNDDFTWGDATESGAVMDLENIATHELGHSAGMGDLYETTCIDETMYGYSTEGETTKRTLNAGDIAGIKELYK